MLTASNWGISLLTINWVALVLFLLGIVFFIIEMFTPGLGVPSALGLTCWIIALIIQAKSWTEVIIYLLIMALVISIIIFIFSRSILKGRLSRSPLVLSDQAKQADDAFEESEVARVGIGSEGIAGTDLRPSGIGVFDSRKLDVLADGEFIGQGDVIQIVRKEGNKIIVKRV